jgi:hypothetical protein
VQWGNIHLIIPPTRTIILTIRIAELIAKTVALRHAQTHIYQRIRIHLDIDRDVLRIIRSRAPGSNLVRDGHAVRS